MIQDQVRANLETLVDSGVEVGAQVAVIADGVLVADVAAGSVSQGSTIPVTSDHLFFAASTAKGIASAVAHSLVERGDLDDDLPIVAVWPEFGAEGKDRTTLRHVLCHTAGVPAPPYETTATDLCDWDHMCTVLAGSRPWWPAGAGFGYHAVTFGFLVGETIRRATGRTISWWLRELITGPLGVEEDVHFGVPPSASSRLTTQVATEPLPSAPVGSAADRAVPPAIRPSAGYANDPAVLAADIPSQGAMTALGAAWVYAALLGHVSEVDLVSAERLQQMATPSFVGRDEVMEVDAAWTYGFSPHQPDGQVRPHRRVFGMFGVNGSGAYADLDAGVAVAVMRNRFDPDTRLLAGVDRIVTAALGGERQRT